MHGPEDDDKPDEHAGTQVDPDGQQVPDSHGTGQGDANRDDQ